MLTQAELALSSHCHCMVYAPTGPPISTGYNQLCGPTLGGPSHSCNIHHRLIHGTWSNVLYALQSHIWFSLYGHAGSSSQVSAGCLEGGVYLFNVHLTCCWRKCTFNLESTVCIIFLGDISCNPDGKIDITKCLPLDETQFGNSATMLWRWKIRCLC